MWDVLSQIHPPLSLNDIEQKLTASGLDVQALIALPDQAKVIQTILDLARQQRFEITKANQAILCTREYVKAIRVRSVSDCHQGDYPSLATLKKYRGEAVTLAVIKKFLVGLTDWYQTIRGMNKTMIEELAGMILQDYYYLNVAEIKLFVGMARRGQFGKVLDRLGGDIIMGWLKVFDKLRLTEIETEQEKQHHTFKNKVTRLAWNNPKALQQLTSLIEELEAKSGQNKQEQNVVEYRKLSSRPVYQSLNHFWLANGLDPQIESEKLLEKLRQEFEQMTPQSKGDIPFEAFVGAKSRELLIQINDKT